MPRPDSGTDVENVREEKEGVYVVRDTLKGVAWSQIAPLKKAAKKSAAKRARICLHQSPSENIHEMLIALHKGTYIRPHRHEKKVESYLVLEGKADLVFFTETGEVKSVVRMGDPSTKSTFFNRVPNRVFHMFVPRSEYFVFKETTNGPFDITGTEFAPWAPEDALPAPLKRVIDVFGKKK